MSAGVGFQEPLWRAIAVFRFASVGYAGVLIAVNRDGYSRLPWAWAVLAVMAAWTAVTTYAYATPARRTRLLLTTDLVLTASLLLATAAIQHPSSMRNGVTPVTSIWVAGPVLAWAVHSGRRAGAIAALLLSGCDFTLRNDKWSVALNGAVLMLLVGVIIGHVARLAAEVEHAQQRVTEIEAASRERERLARHIHDSVLQVLALVQRRGAEAGGEAAELGKLAGEQEAALRALIGPGSAPESRPGSAGSSVPGEADLRTLVAREESALVTVSAPAEPVRVSERAAAEVAAAVRAALDNVRRHCGEQAPAWVLVEDEGDRVTVTVRDDGPGIPDGRLEQAAAAGRLGVSHSILGRIRDLGGSVHITSAPGEGTTVEFRVPRIRQPV